jgi:hypothetical protein
MNRQQLKPIIDAVQSNPGDLAYIGATIAETIANTPDIKPGWALNLTKLLTLCSDRAIDKPVYTVFAEGNSKLPFLSFSAMPGVGFCPGAGDCTEWCYSFSSWRYPAAFCRQVQNTLLLSHPNGRQAIRAELDAQLRRPKYRELERVDFRLYVDGDFRSAADVAFWMSIIKKRAKLAAYGYSKSFHELLGHDVALDATGCSWPSNYVLNVSSGHRHNAATVEAIESLPITRGRFVAVPMPYRAKHSDHGNRYHQKALRDVYGRSAFTCPGECGDCTPSGHACGSERFRGVDIIIAAH